MRTETIATMIAVFVPFIVFTVALVWADYYSRQSMRRIR
jgi:hypothetical protein